MLPGKAIVRQHLEKIEGVSRTWFELNLEDSVLVKTLVVEVEFDTDPNDPQYQQNVLDAVLDTAFGVQEHETTMIVTHLKIVPRERVDAPRPQRREALRRRDRQCGPRHADRDGGD